MIGGKRNSFELFYPGESRRNNWRKELFSVCGKHIYMITGAKVNPVSLRIVEGVIQRISTE